MTATNPPNSLTVGEVLKKSTEYLQGKGRESSRLSAELLLAHVLGIDRLNVYLRFEAPLEQTEIDQIRQLIARRGRGEPVAYLVGEKEFMGLSFEVNTSVLIPRPDSEILVGQVCSSLGETSESLIVDIGTGSGCLLLSILHQCPGCRGIAVDISWQALEIARRNAEKHELLDRVEFIDSDLFAGLPEKQRGKLDWVISNPPYICEDEWDSLAVEIREFEPSQALLAGPDGLAVYRPLIEDSFTWLRTGGQIALEISDRTESGVSALLSQVGFDSIQLQRDLGGHARVLVATKPD